MLTYYLPVNWLSQEVYYFVFNQKINNYYEYKPFYDIGNDIYQARNLNHRGGFLYQKQIDTLNRIDNSKHKYYFKFLGYLETLTTKINERIWMYWKNHSISICESFI